MDYFTERVEQTVRQKVLTDSQVSNYELTISTRQGVQTPLSYNATTYLDNEGRLKGIIAAARDITEQRRLRGELEQRNRELEARNRVIDKAQADEEQIPRQHVPRAGPPLNSIIGFSDLLLAEGRVTADPELSDYLGDIQAAAITCCV